MMTYKTCPYCNNGIPENDKYCMFCGKELPDEITTEDIKIEKLENSKVDNTNVNVLNIENQKENTYLPSYSEQTVKEESTNSEIIYCNNCGAPLHQGDHFCPKCGVKIITENPMMKCPACGKQVSKMAHTCPQCGHPLQIKNVQNSQQNYNRPPVTQNNNKSTFWVVVLGVIVGVLILAFL